MSVIRMKDVTKRFGATTAVSHLQLEIPQGVAYGLIGPNGAGKTTSFSMMAGYIRPTEGSIEVLGHPPTATEALRARLSILPQDAILPPRDQVGEFLVFLARLQGIGKDRREKCARDVLEEVGGKDWWKTRCGELSHGMAKRVQLAQALLGEPAVILLDEPTAGLDPRAAHEVREIVARRKGECTLVISSHNLQELESLCDAAAILDRGQLVAHGTMGELTGASREVIFQLAPKKGEKSIEEVDAARVKEIAGVKRCDRDGGRLIVAFDPATCDAEDIIQSVTELLYANGVRLSGVGKGQGLEKRVMDLTDG